MERKVTLWILVIGVCVGIILSGLTTIAYKSFKQAGDRNADIQALKKHAILIDKTLKNAECIKKEYYNALSEMNNPISGEDNKKENEKVSG